MSSSNVQPSGDKNDEIRELTQISTYDNSKTFLYKKAIELGVPVRFVLIRPGEGVDPLYIESFDLEENQDAIFRSIFDFIRQLIIQDNTVTLDQVWDIVLNFRGDLFNKLEIIWIWLHALPEYRISSPLVLKQINNFRKLSKEPEYEDMSQVLNQYDKWYTQFQNEYVRDLNFLREAVQAQRNISSINPVQHSDITVDSTVVIYDYPQDLGINPLPDIFNSAKNSYVVPFIQYNILPIKGESEDSDRFYKIYKGRSVDSRPMYNNVILNSGQASEGQTIYLNVWAGEDEMGVEFDSQTPEAQVQAQLESQIERKKTFKVVTISYIENLGLVRVTITAPKSEQINEMTLIQRVHSHLPDLPLPTESQLNEIRLSGNFYIYNTGFGQEVLSYLIMNDPLFSNYLYLREGSKKFPFKPKFNVEYHGVSAESKSGPGNSRQVRTRSALSATLSEQLIPAGQAIYIKGNPNPVVQNSDNRAVYVLINRAQSRKVIDQFMNILARLFRRYLERGPQIQAKFEQIIQTETVLEPKVETKQPLGTQIPFSTSGGKVIFDPTESRIKNLRHFAPEIFVTGYARNCQKPKQPKLIRPDEIEVWKAHKVVKGGLSEERQVLQYPPNDPNPYYLVCPNDEFPYPGVRENNLENRDKFSHIPCCFKDRSGAGNRLHQFHNVKTIVPKKSNTNKNYIVRKTKSLDPERKGRIPPVIEGLLNQYDDETGQLYRYGVYKSTNSFIHCVLRGLEQPDYMMVTDKEDFVQNLRTNLFSGPDFWSRLFKQTNYNGVQILPEVMKQELYDMSLDDIKRIATDNEVFFDPLMFYRAMEILFDCNIYVFTQNEEDKKTQQKTSFLQLPRHRYFHAHPPVPGKPVILISRHWGSDAERLSYPQCELIIDERDKTEIVSQYWDSMNNIIYRALMFVARTLTWQIFETESREEDEIRTIPQITSRMNVYSVINYQMLFGEIPIIGQHIDAFGKARIFALAPELTQDGQFSPLRIFVNVPPTAPLNVPHFSPEQASDQLPSYTKIIEMFGQPISATASTGNEYLSGLWFPFSDIQFGFYCPCEYFSWKEFLSLYPEINKSSEMASLTVNIPRQVTTSDKELSRIQRIRILSRSSRFINQIIKYLYLVAGVPEDVDEFLLSIAGMLDPAKKGDSVEIYDISGLSRILPIGDVQSILAQLFQQAPKIFPNGRVLMYDQKMLDGIRYGLRKFSKTIKGLNINPSQLRELQNFYDSKNDFDFDPQSQFVISSLTEFHNWQDIFVPSSAVQQRPIQNLKDTIQTSLNAYAFTYQEPYIYQHSLNNIIDSSYDPKRDDFYMIQNVAGSDFKRAIQVALTWYLEKRNLGFRAPEYQPESKTVPAHVIYVISPNGGIIEQVNNSQGRWYLKILNYGQGQYAAMLPIL